MLLHRKALVFFRLFCKHLGNLQDFFGQMVYRPPPPPPPLPKIARTPMSRKVEGVRFNKDSILDVRTHFKPTETFQYTNLYSCHPPGVTKGFIKGEALRLLRTNSSEITFEENMRNFSTRLKNRDYPATTVEKHLSEVIFADRKKALEQRNKNASKKILPFVTQYHPALPNLKNILMGKWHLIQN